MASDVRTKSGTITTGSTGIFAITGLGFRPKLFMILGASPSGGGFANNSAFGCGFTDGTTKISRVLTNTHTSNAVVGTYDTTTLYKAVFSAGTLWHYDLVSFNSNSITLNAITSTAGTLLHWIAIGGTDFECEVREIQTDAPTTGVQTITGATFEPNFVMSLVGSFVWLGLSVSDGLNQYNLGTNNADGAPSAANTSLVDGLYDLSLPAGVEVRNIEHTSFTSDGLTFDRVTNSVNGNFSPTAIIRAEGVETFTFDQPTSTGQQTINLATVRDPSLIFLVGSGFAYSAPPHLDNSIQNSFGYATSLTNFGCIGTTTEDAGGNNASRFGKTNKMFCLIDATTPSVVAEAEIFEITEDSFTLDWTTVDGTARKIFGFALSGRALIEDRNRKRKNTVEVKAGGTHHMTFAHETSGLVRDDFTIQLVKNGEIDQSRPVEIREIASGIYNASFINDSEDHAIWTLMVSDPDVQDVFYIETWRVRELIAEQNIKQVRSRMDGDGGFFNTSGNG